MTTEGGGRGVLDGAFDLLETLARAEHGAGLSELARDSGLPKATTHRLLEQLVARGAVQRHNQRYYIGRTLARLGRGWQPDPALRRASLAPCRSLARLTAAAAMVAVLDGGEMRVVAGVGTGAESSQHLSISDERVVRTAVGQVLLAAQPPHLLPPGYSWREWKRVRDRLTSHASLAVDHQDVAPGVYCYAAAIPSRTGQVASISVLFSHQTPPKGMGELVARAARDVTRTLSTL